MKKWTVVMAAALSACASTGILPMGNDVYLVSKQSPGCGLGSADSALAEIYKEANTYCDDQGKKLKTIDVKNESGIPFVRCGEATLHFSCV